MDILGFKVSAPRLPSLSEVRQTASRTVQHARQFGDAAVSRARDLGRQGADLGRRAIADPEGTARSLAGTARRGIDRGISSAQTGVRDGVMWTGRQIGRGAEAARQAVPGDNAVSRVVRNTITGAENRARFTVGVAGGVVNEAVGLAGTVGTLGVTAAELQVSPTARAELGNAVTGAVRSGARAVGDYGQAVAADPGRVLRDASAGADTVMNAGGGFIEGQVNRHQEAFRRGEGFETLGMTTGQVATYLVPVGAGGRAAATGARGLEAVAGGARVVAREATEGAVTQGTRALAREGGEGALRAAGAETGVARLTTSPAAREAAEAAGSRLVAGAEAGGGTVQVARHGGVTAQDLAAASRQSGREVALYRDVASGERYLAIGGRTGVEVPQGSRLIAHTQPGAGASAVRASVADEAALSRLGQHSSVIIDEAGTAATRFQATERGAALARTEDAGAAVRLSASRNNPLNLSTAGRSADEAADIKAYAQRTNDWLDVNGPTSIQSTSGPLRADASAAARAERLRAERAGTPYQGQAGHVPDTGLTGLASPPGGWLDMRGFSNQVAGGALGPRIGQVVDHITVDGMVP